MAFFIHLCARPQSRLLFTQMLVEELSISVCYDGCVSARICLKAESVRDGGTERDGEREHVWPSV